MINASQEPRQMVTPVQKLPWTTQTIGPTVPSNARAVIVVNTAVCIMCSLSETLSRITAVITEPGRQSCKQKNPHASPASRASHCYPAFQQWYSTSTPIIFECLVRSFANRSSHSRIAFELDSDGSSISRQPCSDKSFQQPSGVMTAEGR